MTYDQLRTWFMENMDRIPKELKTELATYPDLHFTIRNRIQTLDSLIKIHGSKISKSNNAVENKRHLMLIYEAVKDLI